jgi:hypothetical protein
MRPLIHHELMNARVADFCRQAEQAQIARAVVQASRARRDRGQNPVAGRPAGVLAHRMLAFLGARSA